MNRLSSRRVFQLPSKKEIFPAASCKIGAAGSCGSRIAPASNLQSGRASVELGTDEGIAAPVGGLGGCRRSGMPPPCAPGPGGGGHRTPAAARRSPGAGLRSLRSHLPRPPTKIRRKRGGRGGEGGLLQPLPKSSPCLQGRWSGERGQEPPRRFRGNRSGC